MSEVLVSVEEHIVCITLNRPQARNAINGAAAQALAQALDMMQERSDIRAGVLTGAGGNFCAGMDLKAFLNKEVVRLPGLGFAGIATRTLQKPLVAAVEGYALAGGFEIALACHMMVASRDAKFGLPEVRRGLVPNAGGLLRLPKRLPANIAHELVLTGDFVDADVLAQHGLVNQVTEPGQALEIALALAKRIARNAPLALNACLKVMREGPGWPLADMFQRQDEITLPVFESDDAREGALAFAEKREPVWRSL